MLHRTFDVEVVLSFEVTVAGDMDIETAEDLAIDEVVGRPDLAQFSIGAGSIGNVECIHEFDDGLDVVVEEVIEIIIDEEY